MTSDIAHALEPLLYADIDAILAIETVAYSHPWSRASLMDSLLQGHAAFGMRNTQQEIIAYLFVMPVVDELHLLNFAINPTYQRQGLAVSMLKFLDEYARTQGHASILLEVRASNQRARDVYQCAGFVEIGRRKAYYPLNPRTREDAIVMRKELA